MGMFSYNCLVCGRDLMSDCSYKETPEWMKQVVVFMPDGVKIQGKYDGYGSVHTGTTIWSKHVNVDRAERQGCVEKVLSIVHVQLDYDDSDDDPEYLNRYMWEESIFTPSCYHEECWESVGSPEGFRGHSLRSQDQGFGSAGSVFMTNGFEGWEENDLPCEVATDPVELWATNSVCHFIYMMYRWCAYQEDLQAWRNLRNIISKIDELTNAETRDGNNEEDPPDESNSSLPEMS